MFTQKNLLQIKDHGLCEITIKQQIKTFKKGTPYINVVEPAATHCGIEVLSETQKQAYVALFENKRDKLDLLKFVPASGAATRMFAFLHQFLENFNPKTDNIESFLQKEENKDLKLFFPSLDKFAFTDLVIQKLIKTHKDYKNLKKGDRFFLFVKEMMDAEGLNFCNTPKGLIPFHRNDKNYTTAFEAQLYEAAFYATSNGISKIHFTVSEAHLTKFKTHYAEIALYIENKTGVKFNISYSFQKKKTDTIAVTIDNKIFLDDNGDLIFRPSGHGALLENLNELTAGIIFIKNIDNVVSENYLETIVFQKKVLAGKLLSVQQKIFEFVEALQVKNPSDLLIKNAVTFIYDELKIKITAITKESILKILNRPLRICGVVENTGAPGGGPFLVKDKHGNLSFQIVEMSQINTENPLQNALVSKATHFNPVDLVCGVRNYKGEKFNLLNFSDPDACFISQKSFQGKPIKALEMPGLWNGAMANWNTIFVEVPLITFNPVKTVNDLLSKAHQD